MTAYASAKKEFFKVFSDEKVRMNREARVYLNSIWHQTIGNFFRQYTTEADTKWKLSEVHDYAIAAVKATARLAKKLAGTETVNVYQMDKAATKIVKRFRKRCPKPVRKENMGGGGAVAHGALCELF